MERKSLFGLLIALPLLLTSCDDFGHTHKWSPYFNNEDGTHYRMCYKDSRHIETSEHNFVEEVLVEATENTPGKILKKCKDCGYEEEVRVNPTGQHVYNQEVISDKYLYEKTSDYSSIYYKSSVDGAYGDDSKLFEKTLLPEGYSNVEYLQGSGTEFIDTGIVRTENTTVSYNDCKRGNGRLPYDYQEVEYIEFTGTQVINTGISGNAVWNFDLQWKETTERQLMGYGGSGNEYFGVNHGNYAIYSDSEYKIGNRDQIIFDFETSSHGFYVNDVIVHNNSLEIDVSNKVFLIGSLNYGHFCEFKFFAGNVTKNGIKIADYVPCYNTETGEIGLFDLVTYKFLGNTGTGKFLKGKDVTPGSRLPTEYQEVEFLKATGTQYINTGIVFDPLTMGFEVEYMLSENTSGGTVPFGYRSQFDRNGFYHCSLGYVVINNEKTEFFNDVQEVNTFYHDSYEQGIMMCNGQSVSVPIEMITGEANFYLFALSENNVPIAYSEDIIYSFSIRKISQVILELVPCYEKTTGIAGMFDLVSNEFLTNLGTGEFIVGKDVNYGGLPTEYQEVEYLKSPGGSGAYINTGYIPNQDSSFAVEFEISSFGDDDAFVYGAGGENHEDRGFEVYTWGGNLEYHYAGSSKYLQHNGTHFFLETSANNYSLSGDGTDSGSFEYKSCTAPSELTVFALDRLNEIFTGNTDCKIFNFEIKENDQTIHDYVPCYLKQNGTPGMFDLISYEFLTNSGTGEFEVGYKNTKSPYRADSIKENVKIGYRYVGEEPSYFYGRIYDATVYDGVRVIQKLIPALRNSDSEIGMYDLIDGKFYEQTGSFKNSGAVGHHLDKGVVTKPATLDEEGEFTYTCSICGAQIHEKIPRLAFKINFTFDEGIKEIRIHCDNNPLHYEISNSAYTRNPFSFNYSSTNASVWFEVVCKEGYELDKIEVPLLSCLHTSKEELEYLLLIQKDLEVNITSKPIVNE